MSVRSYIIDDREKKTFLLDREVLVSEDILRQEMAQRLRPLLDLCRPRLRAEKAGRFPLAQGRRPAGDLLQRPEGRHSLPVQYLPPPRRHRLHAARRQCAPLHVHLSRLDLRQRRLARAGAGRRRLCRKLRQVVVRAQAAGAVRGLSRLLVHEPRRGRAVAERLSRRRQGLHRSGHRPVAVRPDGDHRRRAGIRRRRQLEADGREQRRRLSPAVDAFDLAQLHGQFRREARAAAEGCRPGAADQGLRGRARQRPLHHRQRQFPRPAGGEMDSALRRAGKGRDRSHPQGAGARGSVPSGRRALPTPTAIS